MLPYFWQRTPTVGLYTTGRLGEVPSHYLLKSCNTVSNPILKTKIDKENLINRSCSYSFSIKMVLRLPVHPSQQCNNVPELRNYQDLHYLLQWFQKWECKIIHITCSDKFNNLNCKILNVLGPSNFKFCMFLVPPTSCWLLSADGRRTHK